MDPTTRIENSDDSNRETVIENEHERALKEAENGLLQFDYARKFIDSAIASGESSAFQFTSDHLLELNRYAIGGIMKSAGVYRQKEVRVSQHIPPVWPDVPSYVDEMLEYVNDPTKTSAVHISAYLLWRLNWIHPFVDGNGRTSRMISYIALCIRLGIQLPGRKTIPEQIAESKFTVGVKAPYYQGLMKADERWKDKGEVGVMELEDMLEDMLLIQLRSRQSSE